MDLFTKEGQDAFTNGFDTIEQAVDSILIQRKPKQITVHYEPTTEKLEYWPEMDKVKGFAGKHLHVIITS